MAMVDNSNREKEIFECALDLASAKERLAYLKVACGEDAALLMRVQALLKADEGAEAFLPEEPKGQATILLVTQKPGDRIGRYKLLQQIGEGGCGVVYMAEQEEPVRRRVALKVIKLGMDTKQVVARFEAERQALALMDHANIAKVLDAGATEAGRPYFVMELVRGVKITDYCDQGKLSTGERLELFVEVCRAIQHAHQKGVIHRDIKPSNVLVTVNDGLGVPKVIDFGIAKATAGPLTDKTIFTAFEQFIGTPAYMSPEQAVMTSLDVDTRSDIYSLGVLLYELLTGTTPFDRRVLMAAGLDELRRTIREQEPARPSTRLSAMLAAELSTAAKQRQTEAPRLIHLLRGDLDWIVMRCLEKDRAHRYDTVNGLATDIQRHLHNEPVTARPPSALYRLQKLVRRNKLAFSGAAAITGVLVCGVVVSTWQAVRATRFRRQAEGETSRAEAESLANRQNLYAADMNLANLALEAHNLRRASELLEKHASKTQTPNLKSQMDLRGWEWRYLSGQCRSDDIGILGRYEKQVSMVRISADGRLLAAACDDGKARLWDLDRREALPPMETFAAPWSARAPPAVSHVVAFSPDGRKLAAGGVSKEIRIWDTISHQRLLTLNGHTDTITYLDFSPHGELLASASADGTARVWDLSLEPAREIAIVDRRAKEVLCAAFSPDGKILVTTGEAKPVKFYNISKPDVPELLPKSLNLMYMLAVAFSPDGTHIAFAGSNDSAIHLYEFPSLRELPPIWGHPGILQGVAFSPDGRRIASASSDWNICIQTLTNTADTVTLSGHTDGVEAVAFAPNGNTLVSGSSDGTVRLWHTATNAQPRSPLTLDYWIHQAAFSPDSRFVAVLSGLNSRALTLWDVAANGEVVTADFPTSDEGQVGFSSDGKTVVACSLGKTRFYQVPSLQLVKEELADRFIFAPNGRFAILVRQGKILRRDLAAGAETVLGSNAFSPGRVAISPDGKSLAVTGDAAWAAGARSYKIALWNTTEPGPAAFLEGHSLAGVGLAFSPDGKLLASASFDGSVGLWDVAQRRSLKFLRGHTGEAWDVAFSADGRTLASSASDSTIKLWNLASLQEAATLHGHKGPVSTIAFSPDGGHLVSGGAWAVRLWEAPSFEEIAMATQRKQHGK